MTDRPEPPESGQAFEYPSLDTNDSPDTGPIEYPPGYPPMPPPVYPGPYPGPYPGQYPGATGYPYPPTYDPYDPYRQAKPAGTNPKAIAALVTALVGPICCGLPSIAAIVLGIIAMRETKRTGQDGFGLAVSGLVIGAVVTALVVLYFVIFVLFAVTTDPYVTGYSAA